MFIKLNLFNIDILTFSVLISVSFVITLLSVYIPWYISQEPLKLQFYRLIIAFTVSILILSITPVRMIFLFFWEVLRICSYLLVRWWKRRKVATSMALVRLLSSRLRDACFFLVILSPLQDYHFVSKLLIIFAVSSKSAQIVYFPWLLRAIERPRPVSALLHSSTLVLARVILSYRITEIRSSVFLFYSRLLGIILRVFRTAIFIDLKKRVACSTVYNIRFMFIWIYFRYFNILFVHIVVHAIIKASTFVLLRISSHLMNIQDYRIFLRFTYKQVSRIFILLLLLLSVLPLLGVLFFKEYRVELITAVPSVNLTLYIFLILISLARFVFILEYSMLLNSNHISSYKNLICPAIVHGYLTIALVPIVLIIRVMLLFKPLTVNYIISNYLVLLIMSLLLIILVKRRSYYLNFNFVSDYNSNFIGNIFRTKILLLGLEYHSILTNLKKAEWLLFKNSGTKITSQVVFVAVIVALSLLILV